MPTNSDATKVIAVAVRTATILQQIRKTSSSTIVARMKYSAPETIRDPTSRTFTSSGNTTVLSQITPMMIGRGKRLRHSRRIFGRRIICPPYRSWINAPVIYRSSQMTEMQIGIKRLDTQNPLNTMLSRQSASAPGMKSRIMKLIKPVVEIVKSLLMMAK